MRRREFITLLGGTAALPVLLPPIARAQQPLPIIGLLGGSRVDDSDMRAIRKGLGEAGFVEGRNVTIESRSADGDYERLPALAAELVSRPVGVIFAIMATQAAVAAKAATTTIPIVFVNGSDPVQQGIVTSFSRPGDNITGVTFLANTLGAKRLEVLHELVPSARLIGFLINPNNTNANSEAADVQVAGRALGLELQVENGGNRSEIDTAFANFAQRRVDAILLAGDAFYRSLTDHIIKLADSVRIPICFSNRDFVTAGGLVSYGASRADAVRLAGVYAGRILHGEKPSGLPVQQAVKVDLVINLKTAKALGIEVPMPLLMRVDEVIE